MTVGTRSVLFGAHAFWLHPWLVARAWWRLYGFPTDPRLWLCFFVHDLGYLGSPNMDGEEGERHPERAARWLRRLGLGRRWQELVLYHSRFYAKRDGAQPSRLCYADKLALVLTPWWIHVPLCRLSGELHEYMDPAHHEDGGKYEGERDIHHGARQWWLNVQEFLRGWIAVRAEICPDCGCDLWRMRACDPWGERWWVRCASCLTLFEHNEATTNA